MKISLTHTEMVAVLSDILARKINSERADSSLKPTIVPVEHCYFELIMDGQIVDTYGQLLFTYDTDYQFQVNEALVDHEKTG